MFDGKRRSFCPEVVIPREIDKRNHELDGYIKKNFKVDKPETSLPCILNTNFFKGKQ
jgi:hypothetical protein